MVVALVGGGDVLAVAGDGTSGNCPGILRELRPGPLLTGSSVPYEDRWRLANLTCDGPLSVAMGVHIHRHDIVGVMVHIIGHLFRFVFDLASSEILLSVRLLVQNDSKTSSHIDNFAVGVVIHVLPRVLAPVPIHVLQRVCLVWLALVDRRMVIGFRDCANPRLHGQELFSLCYFLNFLIEIEEIIFRPVSVEFASHDLTRSLVDGDALSFLIPFWLGAPCAFRSGYFS